MAKSGKSSRNINYRKASEGSQRGISSNQWNGFLQMHKDIYAGNVGNSPLPPVLSKSIIADAVLAEDSEDIEPFAPCRIVKQVSLSNITSDTPTYVVEAVDTADTPKHGNYAFSVNEGVREEKGGRIILSGLAIVALTYDDAVYNIDSDIYERRENAYYIVNDKTLSQEAKPIAPVGHFKIVSWYDPSKIDSSLSTVYVAVDINQRPTSFLATVDATIAASTEAAGTTTMSSGAAYASYTLENDETAGTIGVEKDDSAYEITVYNPYGYPTSIGEQLISYSLQYNRFIISKVSSIFHVVMTKVGGDQGTATTPCSFTYDIKLWQGNGTILFAGMDIVASPSHYRRPNAGQLEAATFGIATYDSAGDLVMVDCNETLILSTC